MMKKLIQKKQREEQIKREKKQQPGNHQFQSVPVTATSIAEEVIGSPH